jgi:hypothetical protein
MPWRGASYPGEFPSLGPQGVIWIENYLVHGPGDGWMSRSCSTTSFTSSWYAPTGWTPETGRRRYRPAFLSRAKGRAKSELA